MKKKILFGGSFDPIHIGHLEALKYACKYLKINDAIFIPSYISPLKERKLSDYHHRVAMLKLAKEQLREINVEICDYEIKKATISYTIDTVKYFKEKYPNTDFNLLIGSDQLEQFDLWKNAHLISKYCHIICVKRTIAINRKNLKKFNIKLLNNKTIILSSTDLRSQVDHINGIEAINDYINDNFLYIDERVKKWQTDKRWLHTIEVEKTISEIAQANKLSKDLIHRAKIAAIYHDLAKDFSNEDLYNYNKKYLKVKIDNPELLHAHVGADYVKRFYGFKDLEIIEAIKYHTIPREKPTTLEMLLYVADKVEPGRNYELRQQNYNLALKNYKTAFKLILSQQKNRFEKK